MNKKIITLIFILLLSMSVFAIQFRMHSIYRENCDYNVCGAKSPASGIENNAAIYNQHFNLKNDNNLDYFRNQLKSKQLNYVGDLYTDRIDYTTYETIPVYLAGLDGLIEEKYDFRIDNIKKKVLKNANSNNLIAAFNKNTYPQFFDSLGRINIAKEPLHAELLKIIESNYKQIEASKENINFDPTYLFEEILVLESAIDYDVAYGLSSNYFQLVELNISKINYLKADKVYFKLISDTQEIKNQISSKMYLLVTSKKIDELVRDFNMDRDQLVSKNEAQLSEIEDLIKNYQRNLLKLNLFSYDKSSYNDQFNSKIEEWIDEYNNFLDTLNLNQYNYVPPVLTEGEIEEIEEELAEEVDETIFVPTSLIEEPEKVVEVDDQPNNSTNDDPIVDPVSIDEQNNSTVDDPIVDPVSIDEQNNSTVDDPIVDPVIIDEPDNNSTTDDPIVDPVIIDQPENNSTSNDPVDDDEDQQEDEEGGSNQTFVPLGDEDDDEDEVIKPFIEENFGGIIDRIPLKSQKSRFNAFLVFVAFLIYMVLFRK